MRAWYSLTLLFSAGLLFFVQPLAARQLLPRFGGSPAVWTACMLFFQAALLLGYLYAHLLTTRCRARWQVAIHSVLALAALASLPPRLPEANTSPTLPIFAVLIALTTTIGPTFFVLAATAPLLQSWYAGTTAGRKHNPYALYAASNVGSVAALLLYPFAVEPWLGIAAQTEWWAWGYRLLLPMLAACGLAFARSPALAPSIATSPPNEPGRPWRWVALAFLPSSLLLGVTAFVTTELGSRPLLWVLPLAIYLLTFVAAFAGVPDRVSRIVKSAAPWAVLLTVVVGDDWPRTSLMALHLGAFALLALACHCELAGSRPGAERLTAFYLWVAVGGVLGGVFNALVAPVVFVGVAEYPLAMAAACLMLAAHVVGVRWNDLAWPAGLGAVVLVLAATGSAGAAVRLLACAACSAFVRRPVQLAAAVAAVLLAVGLGESWRREDVYASRSFFGVSRVQRDTFAQGKTGFVTHRLTHGKTVHGGQHMSKEAEVRNLPLFYYFPTGPIGQLMREAAKREPPPAVAVVGLGVGSLASYGRKGQSLTFFEIDPEVERIARNRKLFTFLADSEADVRVVIGDARLSLEREPDGKYEIIVIDAFGSDAVPVHLLTREAMAVYLAKLAPGGVLAFHVTNNYLDLEPVVGAAAAERGLVGKSWFERPGDISEREANAHHEPSHWVVVGRTAADVDTFTTGANWRPLPAGGRVWTDDYSTIVGAMRW